MTSAPRTHHRLVAFAFPLVLTSVAAAEDFVAEDPNDSPPPAYSPDDNAPARKNRSKSAAIPDSEHESSRGSDSYDDEEYDSAGADEARFRWGISALGGPLLGGMSGGVGGVDVRFGAQIDDMIGIYGQPIGLVGAGVSSANSQFVSASGLALAGVGALVDFTFEDLLFLAVGPEVLYGGLATGTSAGAASAQAGAFFSIASRVGLALGSMKPERRSAFTMNLDLHVIIANEVVVTPMVALGYDAF